MLSLPFCKSAVKVTCPMDGPRDCHTERSRSDRERHISYDITYESESHSVVSDSLQPCGLYSLWNSLSQNTGVGCHTLLQGIFPTQGLNPGLPHCRQILYHLSHKGSREYWSGQPISYPVDLLDPGIKPGSPALQVDSLPTELSEKPVITYMWNLKKNKK